MMRRLSGLLLVIRALAPVLAVLTLYWGVTQVTAGFRGVLAPVQAIETEMAALGETIDTARAQFDMVRGDVEAAMAALPSFRIPDLLPNLPSNLSIPALDIPNLTVPIVPTISVQFTNATASVSRVVEGACHTVFDFFGVGDLVCDSAKTVIDSLSFSYPSGISLGTRSYTINFPRIPGFTIPMPSFFNTLSDGLKDIFRPIDRIFDQFDRIFAQANALGQKVSNLPDNLNGIASAGQQLFANLQRVGQERGGLVMLAALLLGALAVIYVVAGTLDDLFRGLRLLFGRSAADTAG
jgi:hypothetical protein